MKLFLQNLKGKIRGSIVQKITNKGIVIDIFEGPNGAARLNDLITYLLEDAKLRNGTFIYDIDIAWRVISVAKRHLGEMPQKTLQIGSGHSLGVDTLLALSGVKEAWSIDPYPELEIEPQPFLDGLNSLVGLSQQLSDIVPSLQSRASPQLSSTQVSEGRWKVEDGFVQHFPGQAAESIKMADGSIDFVWSYAVFEHVADPAVCISECYRVLRPGGLMIHQIDLRDHRDFADPLRFLNESEADWQVTQKSAYRSEGEHTNRWRASQFVEAARDSGFDVLEVVPVETYGLAEVKSFRPNLDSDFQQFSNDDLSQLIVMLVAVKPL